MEDLKKIAKSVVNAAAKLTIAAVEMVAVSVEKAKDVAKEVKQNRIIELFTAKEGYKRFVINKTTNPKFDIYEIYNSQQRIEYKLDGKLDSKNCAINFVSGNQVIADVYENKSKRKKDYLIPQLSMNLF